MRALNCCEKKTTILVYRITNFFYFFYFGVGFYLTHDILRIDHSGGAHEGSLPNTWSTQIDYQDYSTLVSSELRKNFDSSKYHLNNWQEVYFPSRDENIKMKSPFQFLSRRERLYVFKKWWPAQRSVFIISCVLQVF